MNVNKICADIDRLFGDMTLDNDAAWEAMEAIARHAWQYAEVIEAEEELAAA